MLDTMARVSTNTLYLVPLQVKRFRKKFPDAQILAAGATKARKVETNSEPQYEMRWATARRSALILTATGLYCGDWIIPLNAVLEATLIQMTGGALLQVSTSQGLHYQFGLQRDPAWEKQTALPLKIEYRELKLSPFALIARLLLAAWLVWSLVQDFMQQNWVLYIVIKVILLIWVLLPLLRRLKT